MKAKNKLIREQIEAKLNQFATVSSVERPAVGWLSVVRKTLGMSLRQAAVRMDISSQGVKQLETRERDESITLKSLREAGQALGLKLVYGFVPIEESLEAMIEQRAIEKATEIVQRTSHTMALENQKKSADRLQKAIEEKAFELKLTLPRYLWDITTT
ncbi:MAG: hypothetical protein Salg2KO_00430 [Salibacteraceae bacterium]